jgi:uncharacterized protein YqfA (UPF0365 family)
MPEIPMHRSTFRCALLLGALLPLATCMSASTNATSATQHADWHAKRLETLRAEDGWLTLVGLDFLPEGTATIGSAENHKAVLEHPDRISKTVLAKGLDSGTAFEILSIDIAEIDVGENIGANLQTAQATADTKRFQAQAEQRRALAVAQEAEYQAEAQKNRALVVLAEAEVPKAISDALRSGNFGLMDYYRMQNLMADTQMRSSIGGAPPQG